MINKKKNIQINIVLVFLFSFMACIKTTNITNFIYMVKLHFFKEISYQ